jgi:Tfp pilus assembly protein PilN
MNTEINLAIRKRGETRVISAKRIKKIRFVAVGVLFLVGVLSSGLFLIIASSPLQKLRDEEKQNEADLNSYQEIHAKQLLVSSQLASISQLLATRPDLRNKIDTVLQMIPPGVSVSDLSIDEKKISMNVTTSSLKALDSFFQAIAGNAATKQIPEEVTTSAIGYSATTNAYSMQITFAQ